MNLPAETTQNKHTTVLLKEAVQGLAIKPDGIYIDGTFGRGGHSREILKNLSHNGRLIAIDRDPSALQEAQKIDDTRFSIVHSTFSQIENLCEQQNLIGKIDGILLDLGVSSPQLDDAERGFSFMHDGPLDMRMDTTQGQSASQWLSEVDVDTLTWVLKTFGEERFAKRIASTIVDYNCRAKQNNESILCRTSELSQLISRAIPFKEKHKHPATRTFQAIRIFINRELEELENTLFAAVRVLANYGRLSIISFHSLEDRMVKHFFRQQSKGIEIPRGLPLRDDQIDRQQSLRIVGKAIKVSDDEIARNPRSRSAVLRVAERISK